MANVPGSGEPKSLGRINNVKRGHQLVNDGINYNSPIIKTSPISMKAMTEFFIGKGAAAPSFNTTAPFKLGEFSGMQKFEHVQEVSTVFVKP